jgi:hypothetical protein
MRAAVRNTQADRCLWRYPHRRGHGDMADRPRCVDAAPLTAAGFAPPGAVVATSPRYGVANRTDVFVTGTNGAVDLLWARGRGAWHGVPLSAPGLAPPGGGDRHLTPLRRGEPDRCLRPRHPRRLDPVPGRRPGQLAQQANLTHQLSGGRPDARGSERFQRGDHRSKAGTGGHDPHDRFVEAL